MASRSYLFGHRNTYHKVLHSGGDAALQDLEGGVDRVFCKGPEAVEFLGNRVTELGWLEDAVADAQAGGGAGLRPTSFFSRAAIIFWPRSKRCGAMACWEGWYMCLFVASLNSHRNVDGVALAKPSVVSYLQPWRDA